MTLPCLSETQAASHF